MTIAITAKSAVSIAFSRKDDTTLESASSFSFVSRSFLAILSVSDL